MTQEGVSVEKTDYNDEHQLPRWHYAGTNLAKDEHVSEQELYSLPQLNDLDLGDYTRPVVSNLDVHPQGRAYFDLGLRLMLSYQHEMAAKYLLSCLHYAPYCALAHGLIALCHAPNYNFKGQAYYDSACHYEDAEQHDLYCIFPSQQVADRHSRMAINIIEEIRRLSKSSNNNAGNTGISKKKKKKGKNVKKGGNGSSNTSVNKINIDKISTDIDNSITVNLVKDSLSEQIYTEVQPDRISDVEVQLLQAIRVLTGFPGVASDLSNELVGIPYANAMRKVYQQYGNDDPEVAYCFAESLMVMNAWQLYEYPSGKPVSPDVVEVRAVLEKALQKHPQHLGLCHMYVHLSEMSAHPELALDACKSLRTLFKHAGHLIHMPTHIDVLLGDYESCVKYNELAIVADTHVMKISPSTAGSQSFYFGYIIHNYHMAAYGCILGGYEAKAMDLAQQVNEIVNESMFQEMPDLVSYLESYSSLDIHTMVRFGRWQKILDTLELPKNQHLMLYRTAQVHFARALAHAINSNIKEAKDEASQFDSLIKDPETKFRILHNNTIHDLLKVDAVMVRGEIAYRETKYDEAFKLLRTAVQMQDNLNYDEPWGRMQPIRHALGGLLLEQKLYTEAEVHFRKDLELHPNNPWALVGLLDCLQNTCCNQNSCEIGALNQKLQELKKCDLMDFDVQVACECCKRT